MLKLTTDKHEASSGLSATAELISASDIPLRTIKFFSVLFSSAYSSMLQVITNNSLVRRRLCNIHCMVVGNCFCHFVVRTSSNQSIASGA